MGTSWQPGLFGAEPIALPEPPPKESAGVRRTKRQAELLARGRHPLSSRLGGTVWLHAEAAPADDRKADGRRCGNCFFLDGGRYMKCQMPGLRPGSTPRASHSEATDCRRWWPGCRSHAYASEEAAGA